MPRAEHLSAPCDDCKAKPGEHCKPDCKQDGCKKGQGRGKAWHDMTDHEIRSDIVKQFELHHRYGVKRIESFCEAGKADAVLRILRGPP